MSEATIPAPHRRTAKATELTTRLTGRITIRLVIPSLIGIKKYINFHLKERERERKRGVKKKTILAIRGRGGGVVDHMVWIISCLRRRSMVSRRGSNFFLDDSRARSCAADMFISNPDSSAAVSVDDDNGLGVDDVVRGEGVGCVWGLSESTASLTT